jgi:hypothetical protein
VRRQEISCLDLPGAETLKYRLLNLRIYFRVSPIEFRTRDSGLASIKGLTLRYPGYRNAELSYLIHSLNYFGVSVIGVS